MNKPILEIESLHYRYPNRQSALEGLSFTLQSGESVGLIGPNGAGKTTLFLCLCGVLTPKSGSIRICDLNPMDVAQRKLLPTKVGFVFQNSDDQLFCSTVQEDVAFGPLNMGLPIEEVEQRVCEALGQVGMLGQEDRAPFQLSGGEKRRVAIAGILAMQPEVLLMDEPSMFLDPRGRRGLIKLINELPGTKLIASHDLKLIQETCSRTILLDEGRLIHAGPTPEVLTNQKLLEDHGLEAI